MVSFSTFSRPAFAFSLAWITSAATAGEIGATSRATVAISLTIAPRVEARSMSGGHGTAAPSAITSTSRAMCISANTPTRSYGISYVAPSPNTGSSAQGPTPVRLEWAAEPGTSKGDPIPPGGTVTGFVAPQAGCGAGGDDATLIVSPVKSAGSDQAPLAPVTILIVPE